MNPRVRLAPARRWFDLCLSNIITSTVSGVQWRGTGLNIMNISGPTSGLVDRILVGWSMTRPCPVTTIMTQLFRNLTTIWWLTYETPEWTTGSWCPHPGLCWAVVSCTGLLWGSGVPTTWRTGRPMRSRTSCWSTTSHRLLSVLGSVSERDRE